MKEIYYCQKCHNKKRMISYDKAVKELEKELTDCKIVEKCTSTCGLGKKMFVLEIDEELYMNENFAELIKEIKENNEN